MSSAVKIAQTTEEPVRGMSAGVRVEGPPSVEWLTPARHIARAIGHRREVRLVAERLEADRYAVFVVLETDPEDLLDLIVDAEHELYDLFRGFPFDIRVMTPPSGWSDADLRRESIVHFQRLPVP